MTGETKSSVRVEDLPVKEEPIGSDEAEAAKGGLNPLSGVGVEPPPPRETFGDPQLGAIKTKIGTWVIGGI